MELLWDPSIKGLYKMNREENNVKLHYQRKNYYCPLKKFTNITEAVGTRTVNIGKGDPNKILKCKEKKSASFPFSFPVTLNSDVLW